MTEYTYGKIQTDRNVQRIRGGTSGATATFFLSDFFVFVVAIVARLLSKVNGGKFPLKSFRYKTSTQQFTLFPLTFAYIPA